MRLNVRPLAVALLLAAPLCAVAQTAEEVGDADSFGRNVKFIGLASASATLANDCTPPPGEPADPNCRVLAPAPGITTFALPDLDTVTLPARATRSLICHSQTPVTNYGFLNPGPDAGPARFSLRATYRFESTVLDDPALIDPNTGLPFGGGFDQILTSIIDTRTLQPGESASRFDTGTRACIGGVISRQFLVDALGLSDAQAREFFRRPITIRVGIAGNAQRLSGAGINLGVRFYGD